MTLTEFLLARYAEDEAWWRGSGASARDCQECSALSDHEPDRPSVDRLLADVEAHRQIATFHRPSIDQGGRLHPYCVGCWEEGGMDGAPNHPCQTMRWLALPYAGHPEFREEWKP